MIQPRFYRWVPIAVCLLVCNATALAVSAKPAGPVARLAAGTPLILQLDAPISSETSRAGDPLKLRLSTPLIVKGKTLLRAGAAIDGKVTVAKSTGRLSRAGRLGIELGTVRIGGQRYELAAVHRDVLLKGTREGRGAAVRRMLAPVGGAARGALAVNGRDPLPVSTAHVMSLESQTVDRTATAIVGARDPLARVELDGDTRRGKLGNTGLRTVTRLGNGYVAALAGGPLGVLQRGASVEVPAGSVIYAITVEP